MPLIIEAAGVSDLALVSRFLIISPFTLRIVIDQHDAAFDQSRWIGEG
jgi:hypothetical protein